MRAPIACASSEHHFIHRNKTHRCPGAVAPGRNTLVRGASVRLLLALPGVRRARVITATVHASKPPIMPGRHAHIGDHHAIQRVEQHGEVSGLPGGHSIGVGTLLMGRSSSGGQITGRGRRQENPREVESGHMAGAFLDVVWSGSARSMG